MKSLSLKQFERIARELLAQQDFKEIDLGETPTDYPDIDTGEEPIDLANPKSDTDVRLDDILELIRELDTTNKTQDRSIQVLDGIVHEDNMELSQLKDTVEGLDHDVDMLHQMNVNKDRKMPAQDTYSDQMNKAVEQNVAKPIPAQEKIPAQEIAPETQQEPIAENVAPKVEKKPKRNIRKPVEKPSQAAAPIPEMPPVPENAQEPGETAIPETPKEEPKSEFVQQTAPEEVAKEAPPEAPKRPRGRPRKEAPKPIEPPEEPVKEEVPPEPEKPALEAEKLPSAINETVKQMAGEKGLTVRQVYDAIAKNNSVNMSDVNNYIRSALKDGTLKNQKGLLVPGPGEASAKENKPTESPKVEQPVNKPVPKEAPKQETKPTVKNPAMPEGVTKRNKPNPVSDKSKSMADKFKSDDNKYDELLKNIGKGYEDVDKPNPELVPDIEEAFNTAGQDLGEEENSPKDEPKAETTTEKKTPKDLLEKEKLTPKNMQNLYKNLKGEIPDEETTPTPELKNALLDFIKKNEGIDINDLYAKAPKDPDFQKIKKELEDDGLEVDIPRAVRDLQEDGQLNMKKRQLFPKSGYNKALAKLEKSGKIVIIGNKIYSF